MSKNVFLVRKMLIDISLTNEAFSDKTIETLDLLIVNKYCVTILPYHFLKRCIERNLPQTSLFGAFLA